MRSFFCESSVWFVGCVAFFSPRCFVLSCCCCSFSFVVVVRLSILSFSRSCFPAISFSTHLSSSLSLSVVVTVVRFDGAPMLLPIVSCVTPSDQSGAKDIS